MNRPHRQAARLDLSRRGGGAFVRLALLAMLAPVIGLAIAVLAGDPGIFNDYNSYWLAGRIVARGGNPYDLQEMTRLADLEGRSFVLGGGYSYPLPFALFMIPLSALPFELSASLFSALSLVVFGTAVAMVLNRSRGPLGRNGRGRWLAALVAGAYIPVNGSFVNGQANLLVFGLLASAFVLLDPGGARPRSPGQVVGGLALGLAAIVKLVPATLLLPLILARRWTAVLSLLITAGGSLLLAGSATPVGLRGISGLAALFDPDSYATNQSLNGCVTRLLCGNNQAAAVIDSAMPPQLVVAVLTGLLALGTVLVLWRARSHLLEPGSLALGLAFALVAASAGAPKNSLWNHTPALLGAWVVLGHPRIVTTAGTLGRIDGLLLTLWLVGALIQPLISQLPAPTEGPLAGLYTVLTSSALYGLLALWLLLARRITRGPAAPAARLLVTPTRIPAPAARRP
jgi:glycosyl transferase family 87